MIGVSSRLLSIVSRFHYHSQKVIGSLGIVLFPNNPHPIFPNELTLGCSEWNLTLGKTHLLRNCSTLGITIFDDASQTNLGSSRCPFLGFMLLVVIWFVFRDASFRDFDIAFYEKDDMFVNRSSVNGCGSNFLGPQDEDAIYLVWLSSSKLAS